MTHDEKLLVGERLRKLRLEHGLTQEETASKTQISLRYYQMLERGENVGSVDLLIAFSELFHCSLDFLLLGKIYERGNDSLLDQLNGLKGIQRDYARKLLELWIESLNAKN